MTEPGAPVTVLLARPGDERQRLHDALVSTGAAIHEFDPLDADPDAVLATAPRNVVVLLDPAVEDALDRYDGLLSNPNIRMLFEEASVVAGRTGWDAARWARHLAAKLHGLKDVLPEGVGDDEGFVAPLPREALRRRDQMNALPLPETAAEDRHKFARVALPGIGEMPVQNADVAKTADPSVALDPSHWEEFQAYDVFEGTSPGDGHAYEPEPVAEEFRAFSEATVDPVMEYAVASGPSAASLHDPEPIPQLDDSLPQPVEGVQAKPVAEALSVPNPEEWRLLDDAEAEPVTASPAAAAHAIDIPGDTAARFGNLALVDDGTVGLDVEHPQPATPVVATETLGAVVLVGGMGGPDPLRGILGTLPADFPRPLLVQQHLDAGNYDRLARQMERAANMKVELAAPGNSVQRGVAYIVPPAVGIDRDSARFVEQSQARGFVDLTESLDGADSALLVLSGAAPEHLDMAQRFGARGAWIATQAEAGCFDHTVPNLVASRGAEVDEPLGLGRKLSNRWHA